MSVNVTQSDHDQSVVVRFPATWLHIARGPRRDLDQILGDYPRADFAVDGTMFESTAGTDSFLLYDPSMGVDLPTRKANEGVTISVVNGVASARYGGVAEPGATVALQTWPSMVVNGRPQPHDTPANRERVWRLGIGVDSSGQIVVVMLIGAIIDLANRMAREGIVNGGYLDGGSSLAAEARGVFRRVHTAPSGSRIPGWILAVPPDGEPSSITTTGPNPQTLAGRAGAAVAEVNPLVLVAAGVTLAALLYVAVRTISGDKK
jgi:hypothetical protein